MKQSIRWKFAQFLEVKWWKNYLSGKDPESYLQWKSKYWNDLLEELSKVVFSDDAEVLDAGCGPAGIFISLPSYQVTAIDPLLDAYAELPHFQPHRYSNVTFKNMPLEQLDEVSKYDVVFCLNAINHVSDIHLAYDKLALSVKNGGYLIVSIDAHRSNFLKKIFQSLPGDVLHPHQYNLKDYENFLTERGFAIEQTILKTPGKIFDYYVQVAKKETD